MKDETQLGPHQYAVGDTVCGCDWRWPQGHPVWRMSSKDGVHWYDDGPLTEEGRTLILAHFGLETIAEQFPLDVLKELSPAVLAAKRSECEQKFGLEHVVPVSTRIGGRISAAIAA